MSRSQKTLTSILVTAALGALLLTGCSAPKELATYQIGYGFSSHEAAFMVAAAQGKNISSQTYLEEVAARQKYKLMVDGKALAYVEVVTTTGGNQAMQLMSQGHLDLSLNSSAALMASVDQGGTMQAICGIHTGGIAVVAPIDFPAAGWDEFLVVVKASKNPVKVGYHSPTSAPVILFEAAIKQAGLTTTADPNDRNADILLVDLKDTKNLLPAMNSKQVDAWVGPSPHPEVAQVTGAGKVILDMKDMPPKGQWDDFPCCVATASAEMIADHPDVVQAFVDVMHQASIYAMAHPDQLATDMADWCGVPLEAAQKNTVKYTVEPTDKWFAGEQIIFQALKDTGKISNALLSLDFEQAKEVLFDFSFVNKTVSAK